MKNLIIILIALLLQACASAEDVAIGDGVIIPTKSVKSIGTDVSDIPGNNVYDDTIVIYTRGLTPEEITIAQKGADEWSANIELVQWDESVQGPHNEIRVDNIPLTSGGHQYGGVIQYSDNPMFADIVLADIERDEPDWLKVRLRLIVAHELGHFLAYRNCGMRGYHLSTEGTMMYPYLSGLSPHITALDIGYVHCHGDLL